MSVINTNLSYDYYLRSSYSKNKAARKNPTRTSFSNLSLTKADSSAMQKIAEKMRALEYSTDNSTEVSKELNVFIATYNNLMTSTSSVNSSAISRAKKNMIALTKTNQDDLAKLGITINGNGTLKLDKSTLDTAKASDFKRIFSSDNDYMAQLSAYAKTISRKANRIPEKTMTNTSENGFDAKA